MLRLIQVGNTIPMSFICDPSAEFQPGQIAELTVIGNQVMATVSNGTAPIGIIDDIKTKSFTNVSWNEIVIVSPPSTISNGQLVSAIDVKQELDHAHIVANSFTSDVDLQLNSNNGVVTFLAGTPLNFDLTGSGSPNAIRAVVKYTYYVPNIPGDDSTQGTGRLTVWFQRMFFQTDQYETNQQYLVRQNLFVSEYGLLTSRKPSEYHPAIAMVTAPPTPQNPMLEVLWY